MSSESDHDEDVESGEEEESDEELIIDVIIGREEEEGQLLYEVTLKSGTVELVDRSDLWDFGPNAMKIREWDRAHPIEWDATCAICGVAFTDKSDGCEECRCEECDRPCRHLKGINYGCAVHPVI